MKRRFHQVDVFGARPLAGNPLAVVHDAEGLDDATMAAFARWANLSETTFLLPPRDPAADYRVRIFTPVGELPFAGHPTRGSCWAWLDAGGRPRDQGRDAGTVVQECGVGLVRVRVDGARLSFAAPPLKRTGPLDAALVTRIARGLGVNERDLIAHQWVDNGPGWCAVMFGSAAQVLALLPDHHQIGDLELGVVGPQPPGHETQFEVRAFIASLGVPEDPVTGSLNAGLAQWLIGAGLAPTSCVVSQGTVLGRAGRIYLQADAGTIWVGGDVACAIRGEVEL